MRVGDSGSSETGRDMGQTVLAPLMFHIITDHPHRFIGQEHGASVVAFAAVHPSANTTGEKWRHFDLGCPCVKYPAEISDLLLRSMSKM